jgi:hypothetical protein
MLEFLIVVLGCFCLVLGVTGVVWAYHMITMNHDRIDEIDTSYTRIRQLEREVGHQGRIIMELSDRLQLLEHNASDMTWGDNVEQTLANIQLRYEELYRVNGDADNDTTVGETLLRCAGWNLEAEFSDEHHVRFTRGDEALAWSSPEHGGVGWLYFNWSDSGFALHLTTTVSRYKRLTDLEDILRSAPYLLLHNAVNPR